MKTKFHYRLAAASAVFFFASCGPQLDMATVPMSAGTAVAPRSDGSLNGKLHTQVNSHRGALGKSSLPRHPGLDRLAQRHSEFMLQNRDKIKGGITHYGFEERAMAAQRLMSMRNVAENIATCSGGFSSPTTTLLDAWRNSSSHAKNMRGDWDVTGIGVAVASDGRVFATQIFASQSHSHMAMTDRMRQF